MKISTDVLAVLSTLTVTGNAVTGNAVVIANKALDRPLYTKTNKVLEAMGGKWSRTNKAHMFPSSPVERLDLVMTTGEIETHQDVGHFPTPVKLAAELVKMAGVLPGMLALEPSAGTGRIVDALLAAGAHVRAVERDDARRSALVARGLADIEVSGVLDFMHTDIHKQGGGVGQKRFDRVVMNPPFCKSGDGDHIDHVRHAHAMLARDGILVAVMPSSIAFREDRRHTEFRIWAETSGTIEQLPTGSFKYEGTGVNTVVVRVHA